MPVMAWLVLRPVERKKKLIGGKRKREEWGMEKRLKRKGAREEQDSTGFGNRKREELFS